MKNLYLTILFSGLLLSYSWSQEQTSKFASKEYASYDYHDAQMHFEKMQKSDLTLRSLGDIYCKTQQYAKAEQSYSELMNSPGVTSQDKVNYISVLLMNEKYKEAITWMGKYSTDYPLDKRYSEFLSTGNSIDQLKKDEGQFLINDLDFNSAQQDFGPVYFKDGIVFTSSREETKSVKRTWIGNDLPFLDLYFANIDSKGGLENSRPFNKTVNKKYNEGPATFTKDGEVIAFTRNNYESKSADGARKLQIFIAQAKNDTLPGGQIFYGWTKPVGAPFNNSEYSVGHPAFNEDGTVLYFASDMPGGYGGTDIYKVDRNPDGSWGKPQNLGPKINTPEDEMFPFLHPSGILFFSSNGHEGLGGLDVFVANIINGEVAQVKNLGAPVNSSKDDFSFILNSTMSSGYFASNREGGKGSDDIYYYQLLKPFHFGKTIKGTTKNMDGNILDHADVVITDKNGKEITSGVSDASGNFSFEIDETDPIIVTGKVKDYTDAKVSVDTQNNEIIQVDLVFNAQTPVSPK